MSHGVEDSLYPFCRVPTTWQCPTPPMVTSSVLQWKCAVFHTGASGSSSFQEQPGPSCSTLLRLLMLELDSLALHVGSIHTDWVTSAKSLNFFEPHVPQ